MSNLTLTCKQCGTTKGDDRFFCDYGFYDNGNRIGGLCSDCHERNMREIEARKGVLTALMDRVDGTI